MRRCAAIALIAGTILAWFGESRPIIAQIYSGLGNPGQLVAANPSAWVLAHLLMATGAIVAALGVYLVALAIKRADVDGRASRAARFSVAIAFVSAALYCLNRYSTFIRPEEIFAVRVTDITWLLLNGLPGIGFAILWQLALIAVGYGLLRAGYAEWLAWPVIILSGVMLLANVVTFGLPPGLNFFVVLLLGIALLFVREPQPNSTMHPLKEAGAT